MEIQRVDLGDAALADAWYEVYESADRFERPFAVPWLRCEIPEQYTLSRSTDARPYAGFVGERIVCVGSIELPLLDNTHSAALEVFVAPNERRRGYGAAMLAHLEGVARHAERRTTYLEANFSLDLPPEGDGASCAEFAKAQGYTFGLANVMRSLTLPVDGARLDVLRDEAEAHHRGYRIEVFRGSVPQEWVAGYAELEARVDTDSPTGALDIGVGSHDVEAFREGEARRERQGRIAYAAVALKGEEIVGFSDISVPRTGPEQAFQGGTLVERSHRGRRLGLALKVANLEQVHRHEPRLRRLVTWNAEENAPMIAVNDQLGFVPVERLSEFQKRW